MSPFLNNRMLSSRTRPSRYAALILIGGIAVLLASALGLVLSGNTEIRYSADHERTIPVWTLWIPSLMSLVLVRLIPPALPHDQVAPSADDRSVVVQTWGCLTAALLFPVLLVLTGNTDLGYVLAKLGLLVVAPLILFRLFQSGTRRIQSHSDTQRSQLGRWYWLGPILPVAAWFYLTYATPFATRPAEYSWPDTATLVITLVAGFLINAGVEELFYRVWLQSRLEMILGRWPAIVLASLVWAVWHIAIQGGRGLTLDIANVFGNQGVQGLFLGYLWSRHRNPWAILLVHGAINAMGLLVALW